MPGIIPGLREITGVWVPRMMSSIFDVGLHGTSKIPKNMKLKTRRNRNKDLQSVEAEMLCSAAVESLDSPTLCRNVFPSPNRGKATLSPYLQQFSISSGNNTDISYFILTTSKSVPGCLDA